jgi:dTDP-4-dehydrorhamnose 3,5-epimerase
MKIRRTELPEVIIIEPESFEDRRGYFMETYRDKRYHDLGIKVLFVQDNISFSKKGVLRGLHYQYPQAQDKLVQAISGEIVDVAVDIRKGSPTYGRWISTVLSDRNHRQFFVPAGFAHGFCVLSESAHVLYKCSNYYSPKTEGGILWSDPDLAIQWPESEPLVSPKDASHALLKDIPSNRLPSLESKS